MTKYFASDITFPFLPFIMVSRAVEHEPAVSQQTKRLGELTQSDLAMIVNITGARVVVNVTPLEDDLLRRVSLIHRGNVIGFDTRDWRHDSSEGPFLSVFSVLSDGITQDEIPTLSNPLVTITPDLVTVTGESIDRDGNVGKYSVEMSKDRQDRKSTT